VTLAPLVGRAAYRAGPPDDSLCWFVLMICDSWLSWHSRLLWNLQVTCFQYGYQVRIPLYRQSSVL